MSGELQDFLQDEIRIEKNIRNYDFRESLVFFE